MKKAPTRDHDAAIRALRRRSVQLVKDAENGTHAVRTKALDRAASYSEAAEFLASITGQIERAAKQRKGKS